MVLKPKASQPFAHRVMTTGGKLTKFRSVVYSQKNNWRRPLQQTFCVPCPDSCNWRPRCRQNAKRQCHPPAGHAGLRRERVDAAIPNHIASGLRISAVTQKFISKCNEVYASGDPMNLYLWACFHFTDVGLMVRSIRLHGIACLSAFWKKRRDPQAVGLPKPRPNRTGFRGTAASSWCRWCKTRDEVMIFCALVAKQDDIARASAGTVTARQLP